MKIPPESPSFSSEEMEAAAEALKWQAASARAAGAKHRARLVDQLTSQALDTASDDDVQTPA
ncbi:MULTISPECIES: hypothetical protein [unclassified Brevundimonas]|uniref:hypothetical protein n=1 Tax=unclassified Brevundimonas TaxID=2622653 RepID=UPI000A8B197C|nr:MULTISPECIES: hypothetical protein [unclassified Brevundimonas]